MVLILYGTQTNTAVQVSEMIAQRLHEEASRRRHSSSSRSTDVSASLNTSNPSPSSVPPPPPLVPPAVRAMDSFESPTDWVTPEHSTVIFVCSTTGQGDAPQTMQHSWQQLLDADCPALEGLSFAVFGLGDSSYSKFNIIAKMLHNRLKQLKAEPLCQRFLGDDQDARGYEDELQPFLTKLVEVMFPPSPSTNKEIVSTDELQLQLLPPLLNTTVTRGDTTQQLTAVEEEEEFLCGINGIQGRTNDDKQSGNATTSSSTTDENREEPVLFLPCTSCKRMTDVKHFQNVTHVELSRHSQSATTASSSSSSTVASSSSRSEEEEDEGIQQQLQHHLTSFSPGDALGVYPRNTAEDVAYVLDRFGLSPRDRITVTMNPQRGEREPVSFANGRAIPAGLLFSRLVAIGDTARRQFFRVLAESPFATEKLPDYPVWDPVEDTADYRERLLELASAKGMTEFDTYCVRERRSYVEVLQDFPMVNVSLDALLSAAGPLSPRYFSIASAPHEASTISLTVAQLKFKTPLERQREGLCSTQLCALAVGDVVTCRLLRSQTMEYSRDAPLILIGPGTGIAPLRSIVRDRFKHTQEDGTGVAAATTAAPTLLFTGHRGRRADNLYGEEWCALSELYGKGKDDAGEKGKKKMQKKKDGGNSSSDNKPSKYQNNNKSLMSSSFNWISVSWREGGGAQGVLWATLTSARLLWTSLMSWLSTPLRLLSSSSNHRLSTMTTSLTGYGYDFIDLPMFTVGRAWSREVPLAISKKPPTKPDEEDGQGADASKQSTSSSKNSSEQQQQQPAESEIHRYVHHLMVSKEWRLKVASMLRHPECTVIVSGNSKKMPKDVEKALTSIAQHFVVPSSSSSSSSSSSGDPKKNNNIVEGGGDAESEAKLFIKHMTREGRYLTDTWS